MPQPLKAYFLQGHGEPSLTDQRQFRLLEIRPGARAKLHRRAKSGIDSATRRADGLQPAHHRRADRAVVATRNCKRLTSISRKADGCWSVQLCFHQAANRVGTDFATLGRQCRCRTYVKDPNNTVSGEDVVVRKFGQHPVVNPLTATAPCKWFCRGRSRSCELAKPARQRAAGG